MLSNQYFDRLLIKENIVSKVPELVLWRHYLGIDFKLGKSYPAPYRIDKTPSFCVFYTSSNKLVGKDHAGHFVGDIFSYIMFTNNLNFFESLSKVAIDFKLDLATIPIYNHKLELATNKDVEKYKTFTKEIKKEKTSFESVLRKPNLEDILYWNSYGISKKTLNLYCVRCVERIYQNGYLVYYHTKDNPCYEYNFISGNKKYYKPFSKDRKYRFLGNINNLKDIQGYYQCRLDEVYDNKILVLTKSLKDVMLLREYDIDSMAIHGENHQFEPDFIRHIKKRYPVIITLYDRDKSGIRGAKNLWKQYQIKAYFINKKYKVKDITDLHKICGKEAVIETINKILKDATIKENISS